ncbi:MAG: class I SAM-dependent methyltransferase, partial [Chitinophagaceae bacterium]|nr:class I SAM-dependent methyltransferase [Chitinophagaceae bacterium]
MTPKDYSSISPSAQSLLLLKGYTNIPYARETAALMQGPEVFGLDFDDKDFWFWMRVLHFENRYWSIDQLLKATGSTNILELSSGYSWRGLELCRTEAQLHYIDTDLPDVIATKRQMMQQLPIGEALQGRLELLPLNAVDPVAFRDTVRGFGEGPLTIVNEGLLMYLGPEEKEQLCRNIREVLLQKGGCWITADVYVKRSDEMRVQLPQSPSEAAFF